MALRSPPYVKAANFIAKYTGSCRCGAVRFAAKSDPLDAKLCHCRDCQKLHGAPCQWAAIFHKQDVAFTAGVSKLKFFHEDSMTHERILPCKILCSECNSPIADE